jgi:hypothetical protein
MSRLIRKFINKLLLTVFAVSFSIYLLALFEPFQRFALNSFIKSFEKETGINIAFSDVDGNLFHHLNFKNVKIGEISEVPEVDISYNIFALLGKKKRISTLYAKKSIVYVNEALKFNTTGQRREKSFIMIDSFALDSGNINYKRFTIPFSLHMKVREHSVQIKRFSLDYPASNFIFSGDYNSDGKLIFFHKFNLDLLEFAKTEGILSSEGELEGTVKNPVGWGDMSFSSKRFGEMSLNYKVKGSNIYLQDINVLSKKFSLTGNVIFNFRKSTGDFVFFVSGANQKVNINGNFNKNTVITNLQGNEISATLECNLGDTINLSLKGKYKNSPLNMTLYYISEHLKGNISVSYFPINRDVSLEQITGVFDLKLSNKTVNGKANLNIEKILFHSGEVGGLNVFSDFKENKAILETAGLIKGKGEFQLKKPALFYFDFGMKDFNMNVFLPEGEGKTDFSGEIKGDIAKTQDIAVSLYIENLESRFRENIIRSVEKIHIKYLYPDILIEPSVVSVNESDVSFSGKIPILKKEKFKINFSTQKFQLEVLNPFVEVYNFKGLLDLDFSLSGTIKNPEISGYLKLDSLFLFMSNDTLGPINISAEASRNNLKLNILRAEFRDIVLEIFEPISVKFEKDFIEVEPSKITLFDNYIYFSGTIPIPFKNEMDFNISTDEFMLKGLNSSMPEKINDGKLSSNLKILKIKPFPSLRGKIEIDNLVLQGRDKKPLGPLNLSMILSSDTVRVNRFDFLISGTEIANDNDVILNLKRESIEISRGRFKIGDNLFSIYGKMPFDKNYELDIYCNFDSLDLSIFSPLSPGSVFSGFVSSSINLKGTRSKPQVYGDLVLENNAFLIKENKFGPVKGTFSFKGDIIDCSDIIVGFNKGSLLMDGSIGFNKNAFLNVDFQKIEIPVKKKSHLSLNGKLKILSSLDVYSVSGEISLDGVYMDPFENQLIVGMLKNANRPASKSSALFEKIKLNIGIGSNFIVNNREAYIKTESDLYVLGTAAKPGMSGETKIIEGGHLNYLGTKFNINEGIINFTDPAALKPEVDLRASSEVLYEGVNYLIFLNISGSPEKLRIEVSSVPYMPVQEVLALLITGKTRKIEPLSSAQGIGMKAVNHILDVTKGRVEDRLASVLGVEKVTLDDSMKIGLEKQIGKKMRVSYKTGFEDFTKPQLVIYYDIMRNISVFSIYDRETRDVEAGFDIDLKK